MSDQVQQKLGKYEILQEIGRGGFGTVYRAIDTTSGQTVALKVLDPLLLREPGAIDRMQREANIAQRLDHRNIVKVLEVGEVDGTHYVAMEYLEGQSLKALIQKEGTLSTSRLLRIMDQVADALDYVHGLGLLHRDVKPSNIIVGEDDKATLTDFGLARVSGLSGFTTGTALLGTLPYMSPEQVAGEEPDHRSDIYSLGVTAYEMCTGRLPFSGDNPAAIIKGISLDVPTPPSQLNPRVGAGIEHVILKSLAKDKTERHQSASAFAKDLREASQPGYVVERPPSPPKPPPPRRRHWKRILVSAGLLLVACIGSAVVGILVLRGLLPTTIPSQPAEALTPIATMTEEVFVTPHETPSATATSTREASPTATPMPLATPTPEMLPTPTGVFRSGDLALAGESYLVHGLAISLSPEYGIGGDKTSVNFDVSNLSDQSILVRYQNGFVKVGDDLGNEYAQICEDHYYVTKQYELEGGRDSTIGSGSECYLADDSGRIGAFKGVIDVNASYLIVTMDQFMGMENLRWRLDLYPTIGPSDQAPPPGTLLSPAQPYTKNGIAIFLSSDYSVGSDKISISFRARNDTGQSAVVRYQNGYFHLTDDLGNEYAQTCEDQYYVTKQYELEGGRDSTIGSGSECYLADDSGRIGAFKGVIDVNASYLIATIDKFMGMENLRWRLDLYPTIGPSDQAPPPATLLSPAQPYTKNGIAIFLSSDYSVGSDKISISFRARNDTGQSAVVRYQNGYFHLTDDLGNEYKQICEDQYYVTKQYELEGGRDSTIGSGSECYLADDSGRIGAFKGVIDVNASYLIATIDKFMGMENLQWRLDL